MLKKKGKPFFPEGARCRLVPRAQAPEPTAPEAVQAAVTGGSGRRPLSERAPLRSLGPVLCTGRVFSHRIDLLLGGCSWDQGLLLSKSGLFVIECHFIICLLFDCFCTAFFDYLAVF